MCFSHVRTWARSKRISQNRGHAPQKMDTEAQPFALPIQTFETRERAAWENFLREIYL